MIASKILRLTLSILVSKSTDSIEFVIFFWLSNKRGHLKSF